MSSSEEFTIPNGAAVIVPRLQNQRTDAGVSLYGKLWYNIPVSALATAIDSDGEILAFTTIPARSDRWWKQSCGKSTCIGRVGREYIRDVWQQTLVVFSEEHYET